MESIRDTLLTKVRASLDGTNMNQLAGELGIDVAVLHRWLTGKRSIGIDTAEHLAAHYGLELKPARKRRT